MALMNKPHRVQPKYECTVPARGTSPSRTYKYDVIQRGGPGHALVIGNDYCPACPHCRKMLRVYGADDESAKVRSGILRAVGWMQVTKSIWLCDECKDNPYAVQTVSDASFLREARPSLAQMYGIGAAWIPAARVSAAGIPPAGVRAATTGLPAGSARLGPPPQMPQQQPPPQMTAAAPPPSSPAAAPGAAATAAAAASVPGAPRAPQLHAAARGPARPHPAGRQPRPRPSRAYPAAATTARSGSRQRAMAPARVRAASRQVPPFPQGAAGASLRAPAAGFVEPPYAHPAATPRIFRRRRAARTEASAATGRRVLALARALRRPASRHPLPAYAAPPPPGLGLPNGGDTRARGRMKPSGATGRATARARRAAPAPALCRQARNRCLARSQPALGGSASAGCGAPGAPLATAIARASSPPFGSPKAGGGGAAYAGSGAGWGAAERACERQSPTRCR